MRSPHGDHTTPATRLGALSTTSPPEVVLSPHPDAPGTAGLPSPNRRRVLCGLAVALVAPGALAACASPAPAAPQAQPADGVPLSSIPVGGGVLLERDPDPVLVVQPSAGQVKAYNASCPHAGTTVDPPAGGTITCPNHFSQFDVATGAVRKGPATTGLAEVPVRVVDGVVRLA